MKITNPNPKSLLNKTAVREFLLNFAQATRHHPFTRVGNDVYEEFEAELRNKLQYFVQTHPSKGRTLSTGKKKGGEDD